MKKLLWRNWKYTSLQNSDGLREADLPLEVFIREQYEEAAELGRTHSAFEIFIIHLPLLLPNKKILGELDDTTDKKPEKLNSRKGFTNGGMDEWLGIWLVRCEESKSNKDIKSWRREATSYQNHNNNNNHSSAQEKAKPMVGLGLTLDMIWMISSRRRPYSRLDSQ